MYILSQWYPPHRTQFRVAMMYGAAAMSGAFSGLLAAAIAEMRGLGGLLGWQWIFILVRGHLFPLLPLLPDT
jgi:MFS family permease